MARLFKFILQTLGSLLLVFCFTAAVITLEGSTDQGTQADVALAVEGAPVLKEGADPVLDRAAKGYKDGAFQAVIVSSTISRAISNVPSEMAKYLEAHGVPSDAIIEDKVGDSLPRISRSTAAIMKTHDFHSVLLVTDYYRIAGLKIGLYHEGLVQIGKAHVGKFRPEDIPAIIRETAELYHYVTMTYILPTAEKIREEAKDSAEKLKVDADKAKKSVDKGLENLPK